MRPEGVLRPIIRDLANRSGAYVIVSAESTSDTALRNRRDAMREAVNDLPNAEDLALDFYDRGACSELGPQSCRNGSVGEE